MLAIVNEVPLGHWKVQAGLGLRQAMLLNGILYNSEAWHGVEKKDIILLEKVDEALLRGILGAHSKIPVEALFLETKAIPIRYVVASRRILFLQTILKREENEMIKRVYKAQKAQPSPGDFVNLVNEDSELIGLDMTESEMTNISESQSHECCIHLSSIIKAKSVKDGQSKI